MYQIVMVRHAIALHRDDAFARGISDEQRPLTDTGRKKMHRIARGLALLVGQCGVIATSPLLRARQTAELVAECFAGVPVVACPALAPGAAPAQLLEWLRRHGTQTPAMVVGHEPDLGRWAAWALTGRDHEFMAFKKGGACVLEFTPRLDAGQARLSWLCTPKQLIAIGNG